MTLIIKVWDVSHGSANYIQTPNGKNIIIDAGTDGGFQPLYHMYHNQSLRKIDWAIITHPHKDHIGEIKNLVYLNPSVLTRPSHIKKSHINWSNFNQVDKELLEAYFELSDRYNSPSPPSTCPSNSQNNGGVEIKTFTPTSCSLDNLNNHSVVTIISYAGTKVVIPGDNEPDSWNELFKTEGFKDAIKGTNVLIAPHHGRKSGFSRELFDIIQPNLIVMSDKPGVETGAVSEYGCCVKGEGWLIHSRGGRTSENRKVLTTRCDGMIEIKMYSQEGKNYLIVSKE